MKLGKMTENGELVQPPGIYDALTAKIISIVKVLAVP